VLRAAAADSTRTIRNIVLDAHDSGTTYVIERPDARREVLYGISVYAQRDSVEADEVLARFTHAPHYLSATVGAIRGAGFEVIATGVNPDHYDVQLVADRYDDGSADVTDEEFRGAPPACCGRQPAP
jgi:hypothetical protein